MAKPNPFVRAGRYFSAWFGSKVDEHADPKVQIQQAIQEAQRQHQALIQQAAAVLGNQRQLQMQLDRQLGQVEKLQAQARQALVLADQARASDAAKAADYEQTAQMLANQLVQAEDGVSNLKQLHDQSLQAAAQARQAVDDSAARLQTQLAERTKLLSQLEQAKMQESVARSLQQMSDTAAPSNTPTLEEVRSKIEQRYANALGQADLANSTTAGRMAEIERAAANLQGESRLAEIRASLDAEQGQLGSGPQAAGAIDAPTAGAPPADATAEQATPRAERSPDEAPPA